MMVVPLNDQVVSQILLLLMVVFWHFSGMTSPGQLAAHVVWFLLLELEGLDCLIF